MSSVPNRKVTEAACGEAMGGKIRGQKTTVTTVQVKDTHDVMDKDKSRRWDEGMETTLEPSNIAGVDNVFIKTRNIISV